MERKRDEVLEVIRVVKPPFKFSARTRVGFSDTDAQGIVYYGRYLPYIDLARVEYHRKLGLLGMEVGEPGVEFVTRACTIEYEAPAVFDDELEVFIRVARIGRTSATYEAPRTARATISSWSRRRRRSSWSTSTSASRARSPQFRDIPLRGRWSPLARERATGSR